MDMDPHMEIQVREYMEMLERRGELRAELQAELRGQRKVVLRLLRFKFGEVSEDIVKRVQDADTQLLERLERNVLFATSIDEMFAS